MPAPPYTGILGKILGYDIRSPYSGESRYFQANPNVAGMAAEDGRIVINPYSTLSDAEKESVAKNEAIRLYLRQSGQVPAFEVTKEQKQGLQGSEYVKPGNEAALRSTLIARILSGDPSAGNATQDQLDAAYSVLGKMRNR